MKHSINRINFLSSLINAENYLEVGVCDGNVFNKVNFSGTKVAVDPAFRFDTSEFNNSKTFFWSCTSDKFFEKFSEDIEFDIVFLDGLHTYEQTFADLCNVLNFCNNSSFIILDDTYPLDEFSALRSQSFAVASRRYHLGWMENVRGAWHGDTYKILYLINHYLRSYDYATILGSGNPQTILWKKSLYNQSDKPPFKRFKNEELLQVITEKLETLNYYKTKEYYQDIFQTVKQEKLFEYLKNSRI